MLDETRTNTGVILNTIPRYNKLPDVVVRINIIINEKKFPNKSKNEALGS